MSTNPASMYRRQPRLGILLFLGNLVIMAMLGGLVKMLAGRYPVSEILFFRFTFAIVAFLFLLPGSGGIASLKTNRPLEHAIRTVSGLVSLSFFYYAISTIPLADATTLAYSAPIFITVLSIPLLGEHIGIRRWAAVLLGFIGVILIAQPTGWTLNIGALAAIGSALSGALVSIWLRRLSSTEKFTTIGIIYNVTGALVFAAWYGAYGWLWPTGSDLVLLIGFGLLAGLQQIMFTLAYRYAEASFLAPLEYFILILAAAIGYAFWNEAPTITTWAGSILIACSGIFVIIRARAKKTGTARPR